MVSDRYVGLAEILARSFEQCPLLIQKESLTNDAHIADPIPGQRYLKGKRYTSILFPQKCLQFYTHSDFLHFCQQLKSVSLSPLPN